MTNRLPLFFFLLSLALFCSCGGVKKPEGFPDLVKPVTVKIHKSGVPVSNVTVNLYSKGSSLDFLVTGVTGSDGVATIQTSRGPYVQSGVPTGKYLVQLTEVIMVDIAPPAMDATDREMAAWQKEFDEKADLVRSFPKVLNSVGNSPLEMDVASAPVAVEFDVSKY